MLSAVRQIKGKVAIVTDGLIMYLTREEQKKFLQNIRKILAKNGGVYITYDFSARDTVKGASKVMYGDKEQEKIYKESAKVYESIAENNFDSAFFKDMAEAKAFVEAQGLKVELMPILAPGTTLYSEKELTVAQKERLNAWKNEKFMWVISVK